MLTNVLLLLDACHAGKYAKESGLFRGVASGESRICIASSLANQKSWEDSYFQRSLFSDAVAKSLTGQSSVEPRGRLVAGQFFERLSAEVVQHAFALKRSAPQEPIIVGAMTIPISLPTAAPRQSDKRSMTTYQVLLRRTRQIGLAALCVVLIGISVTSMATWRPAINGFGFVEVRPGPKWLSPLNIGRWRVRVETDISTTDLKDEQDYPDARAELRDESGMHLWPGLNRDRVRRWADVFIDNYLSEEAAARWRARLRYDDAVQRLTVPGHMISTLRTTPLSTATKLAAESKALDPGLSTVNVWKVQWSNMIATGACDQAALSSDAKERLDGYLHQDPSETIDWLSGLALTARLDDEVNFEQVIPLVKMLSSAHAVWKNEYDKTLGAPGEPITGARIAARFTERPTPNEVAVVADMAAGVLERRTAMNHEAVTADERRELMDLMDGCADVAVRVLAALGKNGAPEKVIAWAHSRLHADQGRLPLRELAAHDGLPDGEIAWVLQTLGFGGDAADRKHAFVEAREWLETIAEIRPLPNDIVSSLIDYAVERTSAGDYDSAHEASLLVAGALPTLSPRDEDRLRGLLSAFEPKTSPLPASLPVVEELGLVAATGVKLSADRRAILAGIIDDSSPDDPARITFIEKDRSGGTGPTQLVPGLTSTHLLAFARFVMGAGEKDPIVADKRTRPFLEQAIADGIRFGVRAELLREPVAAAALALRQTDGPPDATLIRAEIRRHPDDSARRSAAIQIATVGLKTLLLQQRVHVLDELRAMWGAEQEPETKFALATTIIDTISEFDRTRRDVP